MAIVTLMEELWEIMGNMSITVTHTQREGNKIADHLANLALDQGRVQITSFQQMKVEGRRLINNDKLKLYYLRRRPCR